MPIYEYHCEKCTKTSEVLVKNAHEPAVCPHCGSKRLTRLLSTFATVQSSDAPCSMESSCPAAPCCGGACSGKH